MSVMAARVTATPSGPMRDPGLGGLQRVAAARRRDAHADQPLAVAHGSGRRIALVPAEHLGALAQAGHHGAGRIGDALLGVLAGVVADAQFDRDRASASRPARPWRIRAPACRRPRPAPAWRKPTAYRAPRGDARDPVGGRVERARHLGGGLEVLLADVVARPGSWPTATSLPSRVGPEADALHRIGAVDGRLEHLLTRQRHLHGAVDDLGGQRGQHRRRAAPAAWPRSRRRRSG